MDRRRQIFYTLVNSKCQHSLGIPQSLALHPCPAGLEFYHIFSRELGFWQLFKITIIGPIVISRLNFCPVAKLFSYSGAVAVNRAVDDLKDS